MGANADEAQEILGYLYTRNTDCWLVESPLPLSGRIGRGSVGIVTGLLTTAALLSCPYPLVFCLTLRLAYNSVTALAEERSYA